MTTPACRPHVNAGHDPWWTYDELGGGDPDTRRDTKAAIAAEAKAICATCPVRAACLQAAIDSSEGYGIWGGKTPAQRAQMNSATDLPHGTYGALKRHARAGEPQCAECRRFNARKQREAAQRKAAS